MSSSDQQLLARYREGDAAALGELLQAHQKRLYNIVLRMVGHADDAAELTQDALARIVEHIDSFRHRSEPGTWMCRIAMNVAISHLRQKGRRGQPASLDQPGVNGRGDDQATALRDQLADRREPAPEAGVQREEQRAALLRSLHELEPDFRAVIVLRDIGGMDYGQIAETLDLAVGTVKSRLFRARLALRQALTEEASG